MLFVIALLCSTAPALTATPTNAIPMSPASSTPCVDVIVIGGGVVGCAIARAVTLAGYKCAVLEREDHLLYWASGSNSGIACTGVDASPGTLERALIRDAISQLPAYLEQMHIPHDRCGSLVCKWPWNHHQDRNSFQDKPHCDASSKLKRVLKESHEAGDTHTQLLSSAQVLAMEQNLNPKVEGAIHIPGEIVVDPWLYSISLAVHAKANGCTFTTNAAVDASQVTWDGEVWKVPFTRSSTSRNNGPSEPDHQQELHGRSLVCATGAWAVDWERSLNERFGQSTSADDLEAAPCRGQYRIYQAQPKSALRRPIQPVPTQKTKGIFVFSSLYNHIIVGPTAFDQTSKTDRSADPRVADELDECVRRILPGIDTKRAFVAEYVGIRPATNKTDYQIRTHFARPWITVAGIRSTGLTASLGIGRHVTHLLQQVLRERGVTQLSLDSPQEASMPPLDDLIRDFHNRGDGCVQIYKELYRVTHPITYWGWKSRKGP